MLHQTATAGSGMGAGGADAVWRRGEDSCVQQLVARLIALDNLSRQRLRHKNLPFGTLCNAIAAMAQPFNSQDHSAASFSSTPMKPPD
jgi:hypothetical protein